MKPSDLVRSIRDALAKELSLKTGWGRNEVMQAFDRAVCIAALKYIPEAERVGPSNEESKSAESDF
jgi:hypothetical protein